MFRKLPHFACILTVSLSACAKKSEDISAYYVSPVAYQSFSCKQLSEEAARVSQRAGVAAGVQDKKAKGDGTAVAASLLFWPAVFFIKGDKETAAEVARLKGEMEAIEQANTAKNCGIVFDQG